MPSDSVRAAAAAVSFLTRIPVGRAIPVDADDIGRGAWLFPLVGAGIGALAGFVAEALEGSLPGLVAGTLGVGVAVALTGALHLDALADTADGLGAGDRERALQAMRDPRIGSFGAAAVALAVLAESATLGGLAEQTDAIACFAAAGALSRATAPPLACLVRYAREGGGTGRVLSGRVSAVAAFAAAAIAVGLAVGLLGWDGAAAAAAAGVVAVAAGLGARAWLGGVTGDVLGACIQVAEIAALVVLLGVR